MDDKPERAVGVEQRGSRIEGVVAGALESDGTLVPSDGCDGTCCTAGTDGGGLCDAIAPCPAGAPKPTH